MTREEGIKRLPRARQLALTGERLDRAVALYEAGGTMEAIARAIGMPAPTVQNGVMAALCVKRGYQPAERDGNGYMTPASVERLREMLRKGLKGVDIQLRLGVSASAISHERRRYSADLKARGKRPLPRPGGGEMYSGARVTREQVKQVEELLLSGLGSTKVSARTDLSSTTVVRLRRKLVKRLARKGQVLPGCDKSGRRLHYVGLVYAVPQASVDKLRALIADRVPVSRAAKLACVGAGTAYRIRDAMRLEYEARGEALPTPRKLGRLKAHEADVRAAWLPNGRANFVLYRTILSECAGDEVEARRRTIAAMAERDGEDPRLAEQLDRLRRGGTVVPSFRPTRAAPDMTLGGIATAAI